MISGSLISVAILIKQVNHIYPLTSNQQQSTNNLTSTINNMPLRLKLRTSGKLRGQEWFSTLFYAQYHGSNANIFQS